MGAKITSASDHLPGNDSLNSSYNRAKLKTKEGLASIHTSGCHPTGSRILYLLSDFLLVESEFRNQREVIARVGRYSVT